MGAARARAGSRQRPRVTRQIETRNAAPPSRFRVVLPPNIPQDAEQVPSYGARTVAEVWGVCGVWGAPDGPDHSPYSPYSPHSPYFGCCGGIAFSPGAPLLVQFTGGIAYSMQRSPTRSACMAGAPA